ncbi:MAG TPA: diacylglycerol kinase family protein [bacterium]|nr:diacylglycerol kinase family protein [bacterium]
MMFSIKKFLKSVKFAFRGISSIYKTEQNFRFQVFTSFFVFFLMIFFKISLKEAIVLILMISFVLIMEIINSAFEKIADMFKPRIHVYAEIVKNIMAGAVLISSLTALVIGIIIFYPYVLDFFIKISQ